MAGALGAAVLTSGCASILSDSDYPLTISSSPSQAQFTVINENGQQVHVGQTPATLMLSAGNGFFNGQTYTIRVEKPGYAPAMVTVDSSLDGWYIGNLLFGGLIGMLIVDPATGAMWKLPASTSVTLAELTASSGDESSLGLLTLDEVPLELRGQLVPLQ